MCRRHCQARARVPFRAGIVTDTTDVWASRPNLMHNRRSAPLIADTLRLGSVQRSWGTVEPAAGDAQRQVVGADGKLFANYAFSFDRSDRRQHACKIRMQGATRIG